MTSHPLGNVFEVMMDKGQDQIPDEGFLMTKMPMYFIVTVDKIILCFRSTSTLADPNPSRNLHPSPNPYLNRNSNPNPNPKLNSNLNLNPYPNPSVVISAW